MRSSYPAKGARLNEARDEAIRFFEAKGFVVTTEKNDVLTVLTVKTNESARDKVLKVSLASGADGSLNVTFEGFGRSPALTSSGIPTMLGGGFLGLKRLQISEALERLEKQFWETFDRFLVSY